MTILAGRRPCSIRASATGGNGPSSRKLLHCMRHGTTQMNEYLTKHSYYAPGFKDPLFYDTTLTQRGIEGARKAAAKAQRLAPEPELLVISPLTRALETASLAFLPHYKGPVLVEALARERVWLSSDIGSHPDQLRKAFPDPRLDFSHLPDIWWWSAETDDPRHVSLEPEDLFKARVLDFKQWLTKRPESVIAMVAHWGLLEELTGKDFENCEIMSFVLETSTGSLVLAEADLVEVK